MRINAKIGKNELVKLQKKLGTDEQIGKEIGVTRQRVQQIRAVYGIPSTRVNNEERNEKMLALHKSGLSGTKIADKLGLSISQVYRILNQPPKKPAKKRRK